MDLAEACGTGVNVIGILIHEGCPEGSASCQTNVSAGMHGSLSLGNWWGSNLTRVGDGVQAVFKTIITKRGKKLKQRLSPSPTPQIKTPTTPHPSFAVPNTARGVFFSRYVCICTKLIIAIFHLAPSAYILICLCIHLCILHFIKVPE